METDEITEPTLSRLFKSAIDVRLKSHSPYSNFRVGAAVICDDGTIISGCNVENACYGLTICAERTTLVKAISEGKRKFKCMAITSDLSSDFTYPCGSCRQTMMEFGDFPVYLVLPDGSRHEKTTVAQLLPHAFTPDRLKKAQIQK